jgi:hypothetical protein
MANPFRPRFRIDVRPRFPRGLVAGVVALVVLASCGWVGTTSPLPTPSASPAQSNEPATPAESASETPATWTPGPSVAAPSVAVATASPAPRPTARPTPRPTVGPTPTPPAPCKTAPLIYHGSRTSKWIALTIDDGYSSAAVLADLARSSRRSASTRHGSRWDRSSPRIRQRGEPSRPPVSRS